jgi:hypothetical protein
MTSLIGGGMPLRSKGCDAAEMTKSRYQRESTLSKWQQRRIRDTERQLAHAANTKSQPSNRFFPPISALQPLLNDTQTSARVPVLASAESNRRSWEKATLKKKVMVGQNLTRHRAVLALLYTTRSRRNGETREELSYQVARAFNKGISFARKSIEWEGVWIRERTIPEGKRFQQISLGDHSNSLAKAVVDLPKLWHYHTRSHMIMSTAKQIR